ncbi:hypothetical protein EYM_06795 [Ignicoccus islandicus DSM 13165]|uniref:Uncharacterized protein n=1 Tax=Ignicoccus islandicus DSM 13165 TaxID=940295 RepID=A0A0U3EE52_9CREN|nr:Rpp14/Pop5 family protein [Ignicoccus islandicus]ALU12723.1 hypothetical protein EYM_06795 [Ignicoccus islandicus DSM 13165]
MCGGELILSTIALALSILALLNSRKIPDLGGTSLAKKNEKVRKRYILMHVLSEEPKKLERKCLEECLVKLLKESYGNVGVALCEPKLVYFDVKTKSIVVRCNYDAKDLLIASTIKYTECCGTLVKFIPLRAFGTLRSARDHIPKFA